MATRKPSSHRIDPAATVILTREQAGEIQVYLLKRSLKSGFMAGNYVFPGGRVDSEDRQFDIFKNHIDLDFVDVLVRFGDDLSEAQILSFCVAAIRETLEEAGVFLAHRDNELEARLEASGFTKIKQTIPSGHLFCEHYYENPFFVLDPPFRRGDSTYSFLSANETKESNARIRAAIDDGSVYDEMKLAAKRAANIGEAIIISARKS